MWLDPPANSDGLGYAVATSPRTLKAAVDVLLSEPELARALKVRAGEHIAAILLTAVNGLRMPSAVDTHGGIDMLFERGLSGSRWLLGDAPCAAVEVKSLDGPYRFVESKIEIGDEHRVVVRSASDILLDASLRIDSAAEKIRREAKTSCSRNAFLLVHLFDGFAVETFDPGHVVGHLLPRLSLEVDLDTLWVLWHPWSLVFWSRKDQRWTDVLFGTTDSDDITYDEPEGMEFMQAIELQFLDGIGYREGSPWIYSLKS